MKNCFTISIGTSVGCGKCSQQHIDHSDKEYAHDERLIGSHIVSTLAALKAAL